MCTYCFLPVTVSERSLWGTQRNNGERAHETCCDLETTARGISTTLAFLCLDDDLQEEIYQHIVSVVGRERDPVSTAPALSYV